MEKKKVKRGSMLFKLNDNVGEMLNFAQRYITMGYSIEFVINSDFDFIKILIFEDENNK